MDGKAGPCLADDSDGVLTSLKGTKQKKGSLHWQLREQVLGSHSKVCYLLIISFYLEQTKAHPQVLLLTVNQT